MKYVKKQVEIEAFQMVGERFTNNLDWPEWLIKAWNIDSVKLGSFFRDGDDYYINTLEGLMRVSPNDWIIFGVIGEIYPCKPDVFEMSYDQVEKHQMEEQESYETLELPYRNKKLRLIFIQPVTDKDGIWKGFLYQTEDVFLPMDSDVLQQNSVLIGGEWLD